MAASISGGRCRFVPDENRLAGRDRRLLGRTVLSHGTRSSSSASVGRGRLGMMGNGSSKGQDMTAGLSAYLSTPQQARLTDAQQRVRRGGRGCGVGGGV